MKHREFEFWAVTDEDVWHIRTDGVCAAAKRIITRDVTLDPAKAAGPFLGRPGVVTVGHRLYADCGAKSTAPIAALFLNVADAVACTCADPKELKSYARTWREESKKVIQYIGRFHPAVRLNAKTVRFLR